MAVTVTAFPSPTQGIWYIGPLPLRAYALFILLGIVAACAIAEVRLRQRGAPKWMVLDIAVWAVPFGILGGRIYHVITSPDDYFGEGGRPMRVFAIWEGGLGIWGAVALGGVGAWIACRRAGVPLTFFADALAPGLPVAQAIGRLGNWFNNELYGSATSLPWGLTVYDYDLSRGQAVRDSDRQPDRAARWPLPPDVPVRTGVEPRGRRAGVPGGPQVEAGQGPGVRALRDGVLRRPVLDRGPARRRGPFVARPAGQQLGVDPGLPGRADLLPARARPAGARQGARGRAAAAGHRRG